MIHRHPRKYTHLTSKLLMKAKLTSCTVESNVFTRQLTLIGLQKQSLQCRLLYDEVKFTMTSMQRITIVELSER
jgi:hypothetical protein